MYSVFNRKKIYCSGTAVTWARPVYRMRQKKVPLQKLQLLRSNLKFSTKVLSVSHESCEIPLISVEMARTEITSTSFASPQPAMPQLQPCICTWACCICNNVTDQTALAEASGICGRREVEAPLVVALAVLPVNEAFGSLCDSCTCINNALYQATLSSQPAQLTF